MTGVVVRERGLGKSTLVAAEVADYLGDDPTRTATIVVPTETDKQRGRAWDRLRRDRRVRIVAVHELGYLRGLHGPAWCDSLDSWEHGIYEPGLAQFDLRTVTATPIHHEELLR